ncbi:hypothetical protein D9M71_513110 [compost metagenome]
MAATLGTDLVFDMDGRGAELDHRLDGTGHVEGRRAEAGIDVDQQRQVADIGNTAYVGQDVVQASDTQVRHTERACGDTATREVDSLEAGALGQQRVVGIDRANNLQRMLIGNGIAKTLAWAVLLTHDSPRGLGSVLVMTLDVAFGGADVTAHQ